MDRRGPRAGTPRVNVGHTDIGGWTRRDAKSVGLIEGGELRVPAPKPSAQQKRIALEQNTLACFLRS